jgi:hypothetical protein
MRFLHFHMYFQRNIDMIFLKAQYFNLNRILLQSTALWPFQQSKFAQLQFIISLIILIAAVICQVKNYFM